MLLTPASRLCVVDLQGRLLAAVQGRDGVLARCVALAKAAALLGVPAAATEQNPAGIGPTVPELAAHIPTVFGKATFDAARAPGFLDWARGGGPVVLAGTETHVCVLQTALGLKAAGLDVACVADACGSRRPSDHAAALARLSAAGVAVLTTEMVLFEWLGRYDRAEFRPVLSLIKGLPLAE